MTGCPKNVPQWHIDDLELKLLKKGSLPQGHFDPSVSLRAGNKPLM